MSQHQQPEDDMTDQPSNRPPASHSTSLQAYESATSEEALRIVGRILSLFPERDEQDATVKASRLRGYVVAVDGFSVDVLLDAERRILRGTVADVDPRFMPTPPQLSRLCDHIRGEHYRSRAPKVEPVPVAEPGEEESRRMAALALRLSRELAITAEYDRLRNFTGPTPGLREECDAIARRARGRGSRVLPPRPPQNPV